MIRLEDCADLQSDLGPHAAEVLRGAWSEAVRAFSREGLERWLSAARALHALGRGPEPVVSFLQESPTVARELGEASVGELVQAALAMASRTSGPVIGLMLASSGIAARRLGDADLFRAWLGLVDHLLGQAPRSLRPMLAHTQPLLAQLSLGGLRRWALWGVRAHRSDLPALERYFALESADSLAVLQQERKGVLFADVQRRIGMYLRALWGRDFFLRPCGGEYEAREAARPYIEGYFIHLPDALDDWQGIGGIDLYRAAAAHCAAHQALTVRALNGEGLTLLQRALVGAIEDARVEALAARRFPGLATQWRRLHRAVPASGDGRVGHYLDRLGLALADPAHEDGHPWIANARLLWAQRQAAIEDESLSWDIGIALAHGLARFAQPYDPRLDVPSVAYRDDNRWIWEFDEVAQLAAGPSPQQVRRRVSLMELVNEVDVETAGEDAQEVWILPTELYDDQGAVVGREQRDAPRPWHYPEWDYQIQLERPSWCTVLEKPVAPGRPELVDDILLRHKPLVGRLKRVVEALQPQGLQLLRRQEDGDEIDLDAAVRAGVELRLGRTPDPRIGIRHHRRLRDVAVLLLLDLSRSANQRVREGGQTVLELTREAAVLLGEALERIGDPFAIHGFASNGRHDVEYYRFKDFAEAHGPASKARLAGMRAELSTRMGAAVRHAGSFLVRRPQRRRLLLVLTDGEPADVDVRDPQYLRWDARKAVEGLAARGVSAYCLSLDPHADTYVSRIFGRAAYRVVDSVQRLPEVLPALYMGLTR